MDRLIGSFSGMGFDRIAAMLDREGVPTPTAGKKWHGFAVNQILKRAKENRKKVQ
jgi:hypothetical protein